MIFRSILFLVYNHISIAVSQPWTFVIKNGNCFILCKILFSNRGEDPELELGGLHCLFHVSSFLALLFPIGNIAVWEGIAPEIRS